MWMCVFCLKKKFSMFHKLKKKFQCQNSSIRNIHRLEQGYGVRENSFKICTMHRFKGSRESCVQEPQTGANNAAAWGQARAAGQQGPHPGILWATHPVQWVPQASPQIANRKLQFGVSSIKRSTASIMSNEECPLSCNAPT